MHDCHACFTWQFWIIMNRESIEPDLCHFVHRHWDAVNGEGGQVRGQLSTSGGVFSQSVLQILQHHALILPHLDRKTGVVQYFTTIC